MGLLNYYGKNLVSLIILLNELTDAQITSKYFNADVVNYYIRLFNGSPADVIKYARH